MLWVAVGTFQEQPDKLIIFYALALIAATRKAQGKTGGESPGLGINPSTCSTGPFSERTAFLWESEQKKSATFSCHLTGKPPCRGLLCPSPDALPGLERWAPTRSSHTEIFLPKSRLRDEQGWSQQAGKIIPWSRGKQQVFLRALGCCVDLFHHF